MCLAPRNTTVFIKITVIASRALCKSLFRPTLGWESCSLSIYRPRDKGVRHQETEKFHPILSIHYIEGIFKRLNRPDNACSSMVSCEAASQELNFRIVQVERTLLIPAKCNFSPRHLCRDRSTRHKCRGEKKLPESSNLI